MFCTVLIRIYSVFSTLKFKCLGLGPASWCFGSITATLLQYAYKNIIYCYFTTVENDIHLPVVAYLSYFSKTAFLTKLLHFSNLAKAGAHVSSNS